ncbi:MAG: PIG-L family deacetylase [Thermoplasmatales archaeon]|nr:PIG-L family deacetylase [Candidatus Thermoplasmatota archaeon]MDA8054486.1 PIG-L family deacetylase [Thermoplasmatales archaeon]
MHFSEFLRGLELSDSKKEIMESAQRIICVSPHPDDCEEIAGGFIHEKIREGASVRLVLVSDGRMGSRDTDENELVGIRMNEEMEAMRILGTTDIVTLGFRDSEVPVAHELRRVIMKELRRFSPELVITVDPFLSNEIHPDHINTGLGVMQAVFFHEKVHMGEGIPKSSRPNIALGATASPNVIIDCSSSFGAKINSLRAHRSQVYTQAGLDSLEKISELYGKRINARYGEAFKVLIPTEMHGDLLNGMSLD